MRRIILGILSSAISILLLSNCQGKVESNQHSKLTSSTTDKNLLASSSPESSGELLSGENITFTTADGIVIVGTFYTCGKENAPAILCLHQWMSDRSTYSKLVQKLVAEGIHVLTIDSRGFGESTTNASGKKVDPDRRALKDVEGAVAFLKKQKNVDAARLGIIGASYGASNALMYASTNPAVRAICLLSPGVNYFNVLPTEDAIKSYGDRPLMSVASKEDRRSAEAVELYQSLKKENHVVIYLEGSEHGTGMFNNSDELFVQIINFFRKSL